MREEVNRRTRMILGESCLIPFPIGEGVQVELEAFLAEIFRLRGTTTGDRVVLVPTSRTHVSTPWYPAWYHPVAQLG